MVAESDKKAGRVERWEGDEVCAMIGGGEDMSHPEFGVVGIPLRPLLTLMRKV